MDPITVTVGAVAFTAIVGYIKNHNDWTEAKRRSDEEIWRLSRERRLIEEQLNAEMWWKNAMIAFMIIIFVAAVVFLLIMLYKKCNTPTRNRSEKVPPGGSSGNKEGPNNEWSKERDVKKAAQLFRDAALRRCDGMKPLSLTLNMLGTVEERHRSIITFYKTPDVEWASRFICHLEGDPAVGEGVKRHVLATIMEALQTGFCLEEGRRKVLLFEGEKDHLIPSCRLDLIEDGLFIIAGRIMGHMFLHGGPSFTGLSPTILHVILGGDPKMAPISVADCADIEVREVLKMLEGTAILTEDQRMRVNHICMSYDMPEVDRENRKWLYEKILHHAVLGRTVKQVAQLQRGLKDSGVYDLLSARPDTAAILFPRRS